MEEKIKELEDLLTTWEASCEKAIDHKNGNLGVAIGFKIQGLKAALAILKEPSNTQMQTNQEPCDYCDTAKKSEYFDGFSFCPNCGSALDR